MHEKEAYLFVLKDVTLKKIEILDQVLEMTYLLEEAILKFPLSYDLLIDLVSQKSMLVNELEQLDISFETTYQNVESVIKDHYNQYKNEIKIIQELIKQLMETSIQLSALETKVKQGFDELRRKQRSDIQKYHVNKKITSNYNPYQHMKHIESIFFDKKN